MVGEQPREDPRDCLRHPGDQRGDPERRRAAGRPVLPLGFGEAGLPVHESLVEALSCVAGEASYGPVVGVEELRAAAAGYWSRRGPGHRPGAGRRGSREQAAPVRAPARGRRSSRPPAAEPGSATPPRRRCWLPVVSLPRCPVRAAYPIRAGSRAGPRPRGGDARCCGGADPPGQPYGHPRHGCGPCEPSARSRSGTTSGSLPTRSTAISSMTTTSRSSAPRRWSPTGTVITTGLSKSLALGGWRIGVARFRTDARGALRADVAMIASEIWSAQRSRSSVPRPGR